MDTPSNNMADLKDLCKNINDLCAIATKVSEESFRITIKGDELSQEIAILISKLHTLLESMGLNLPTFQSGNISIDPEERGDFSEFLGASWSITLGKTALTELLTSRQNDTKVLFFSTENFNKWVSEIDPFIKNSPLHPDFTNPITIFVDGLAESFGGPSVWVVPLNFDVAAMGDIEPCDLPSSSAVHKLIHINSDCLMIISPLGWVITWGNLEQDLAKNWLKLSAMVLSACLVQELYRSDNTIHATLRGTKLISVPLTRDVELGGLHQILIQTVLWVYDQRPETRVKLIMDRLSIDFTPTQSLLVGMKESLPEALKQAMDSYAFVILDRKDAYHKEMRELMKDMKSQADLYAAKVRDLVSAISRDVLGILVFLAASFLGKFDQSKIHEVIASNEFSLLMKFMAGYLIVSFTLQLLTHLSDANLSYRESTKWLKVLQNYTSREDNNDGFIRPILNRRLTLFFALGGVGLIYVLLAILVWNLTFVIQLLLAQ
jgi:hypothetical protein